MRGLTIHAARSEDPGRHRPAPLLPSHVRGGGRPARIRTWRRETYRLPRDQARETAREWFERYPKAAYLTKVESWRVTEDGLIEFTMRRLPTAD